MLIDTNKTVSITHANQHFSQLLKQVDEMKDIIIMKRNKPKYVVMDFSTYEDLVAKIMQKEADKVMEEFDHAMKELAK